jgi:glycosyltransferase involved in cell wall biosynthesis
MTIMSKERLASIIITSYNYDRYLNTTIDSALNQTYPNVEVIVVDDGSTDRSIEIITSYGRRITSVLKENGGQGSAFNAGFNASRGEVVFFLDSDDALHPGAVEAALKLFSDPEVVKVHWPLWIIDQHGNKTGKLKEPKLPRGDFRKLILACGPMTEATLPSAPTSGNAYTRTFLERVMPMPETLYRICPDAYLFGLAPAFGKVERISEPQGYWRFHGLNASKGARFESKLRMGVRDYEQQCIVLKRLYKDAGITVNAANWKAGAWWPRIERAVHEITTVIPEGETFILADGDGWGTDEVIAGRRRISFIERDGRYWGAPSDDNNAIEELERLRQLDLQFIVFAWPVYWWLEHYCEFRRYLFSNFSCVLENDCLTVFDLQL